MNTTGVISHTTPKTTLAAIRPYSNLLHYLGSRIQQLLKKINYIKSGELLITEQGQQYALFDSAIAITTLHIQRMKARIPPGTQLLVFVSDHFQPMYGQLEIICQQSGLSFVDGVAAQVVAQEQQGKTVRTIDGYHWNEAGHQVVADALYRPLKMALAE